MLAAVKFGARQPSDDRLSIDRSGKRERGKWCNAYAYAYVAKPAQPSITTITSIPPPPPPVTAPEVTSAAEGKAKAEAAVAVAQPNLRRALAQTVGKRFEPISIRLNR